MLLQARSLSLQGWGLIDLPLRASNEGSPRPRVARAQEINSLHSLPLLNLRSSTDYPLGMELPDLKDDPYLKVLRPLMLLSWGMVAGNAAESVAR